MRVSGISRQPPSCLSLKHETAGGREVSTARRSVIPGCARPVTHAATYMSPHDDYRSLQSPLINGACRLNSQVFETFDMGFRQHLDFSP